MVSGRIAGGLTVDAVVGLQDVMPTVLDWAGVAVPAYAHGRSVRPWLEGQAPPWRDAYYVETVTDRSEYVQRCIRTDEWKLILSRGGPHALYHLTTDPEEDLDLYAASRGLPVGRAPHDGGAGPELRELAGRLRACASAIDDPTGIELADSVLA